MDVKKLAKQSIHKSISNSISKGQSNNHHNDKEREKLFERISDTKNNRKPGKQKDNLVLYDNIVTEKIAEMKWNKKSNSFSKKT